MLATEELSKSMQHQSGEFSVTARKLAEFLDSVQADEVLLEQRLGDMESRAEQGDSCGGAENDLPGRIQPGSYRGYFLRFSRRTGAFDCGCRMRLKAVGSAGDRGLADVPRFYNGAPPAD